MASSMEIRCAACRHLTLARAEPVYEDFKKVAETFVCTACGHRYPSREQTPFVDADGRPRVFSEADKPAAVKVFKSDERRRSCAWCRYFIVNPFSQRCGLNNREVEATDVCARFSAKPEQPAKAGAGSATTPAANRFEALFQKDAPPAAPAVGKKEEAPVAPAAGAEMPVVPQVGQDAAPGPSGDGALPTKAVARKQAATPVASPAAKRASGKPKTEPAAKKPVGRPRKKVG